MQSLSWYVKRLRMMSAGEVLWRVNRAFDDHIEALRVMLRSVPRATVADRKNTNEERFESGFCVFSGAPNDYSEQWKNRLLEQADNISEHKLSYFNLDNVFIGDPIDWHRDHSANRASSRSSVLNLDYRCFDKNGDCKQVWEPNRHHHLVVLARAYRISKEPRYAEEAVAQLSSWFDANPYGYGMNWRSPLELAIRLINWVWMYDLIKDSGLISTSFEKKLVESVYLHCRDISRKFSRGTSANNHLIGEAAGLYIASSYFSFLRDSTVWRRQSKRILEREIIAQSYSDGGGREHAFSYQFFTWQFFLLCGLTGRWTQDGFSTSYWQRLERMAEFLLCLGQGGPVPMLGDQDDGYVLDLGDRVHDVSALASVASALFPALENIAPAKPAETAYWLELMSNDMEQPQPELKSRAFSESGYYLLQSGCGDEQASILFDCAELGYTDIAAHGHADALSVVIRLGKDELLVDSGTYDYFTYPAWRNYFRSTRAHNTLVVDELDQSVNCGAFMWQQHAGCNLTAWLEHENGGRVCGEHNGYRRLSDPVTHGRCVELDGDKQRILISDDISCIAVHTVQRFFHFSEQCSQFDLQPGCLTLKLNGRRICFKFTPSTGATLIRGRGAWQDAKPGAGWISRRYHCLTATTALVLETRSEGDDSLTTEITWSSID